MLAPRGGDAVVVDVDQREVGHEPIGSGTVPVLLAGLEEDAVAGADLLHRPAAPPTPPDTLEHECPAVIGNTIAWMDNSHLTVAYSTQITEPFSQALREVMKP